MTSSSVRFDLKQIAQWDREIQTKSLNQTKKTINSIVSNEIDMTNTENTQETQYRDRAFERRKQERTSHSNDTIEFDSEQQKYFHGSLEHTHLIKGLDHELLNKMRQTIAIQQQTTRDLDINQMKTITLMGEKLKQIIFKSTSQSKQHLVKSKKFQRLSYYFKLNDSNEFDDLPVIKTSSLLDSNESEYMIDTTPKFIIDAIAHTFLKFKEMTGNLTKKQSTDKPTIPSRTLNIDLKPLPIPNLIDDIYGDIFDEPIGNYVPVGQLTQEESELAAVKVNSKDNTMSKVKFSFESSLKTKNIEDSNPSDYYTNLNTAVLFDDDTEENENEDNEDEEYEEIVKRRVIVDSVDTDTDHASKTKIIHRNVFESSIDNSGSTNTKGISFLQGKYDVYPETSTGFSVCYV